jgi:hypothetical protein
LALRYSASQEFAGSATVNAFNMDGLELKAMINFPLGDTVSGRISYSDRRRDGFIENVYDPSHVPSTFYTSCPPHN